MKASCLKCARFQQLKGYKVCRECYKLLWGVLVNNLSAELELSAEQTAKLVRITDEMDTVLTGAEETGLDPGEYAEYLVGKAAECTDRLRHIWGVTEMTYDEKIAFLRRYRDAQRTMRRLLEELQQLRAEATSVSQALSGMPSGGGDGQAIPRAVERIDDAERRLASAYGTALAERCRVKDAIDTVPDPLRRDILTRRYILGQRWERIAADNNFTMRRVLQIHKKAVAALEIA